MKENIGNKASKDDAAELFAKLSYDERLDIIDLIISLLSER